MQESGPTQDFVSTGFPPVANNWSTACSASCPPVRGGRRRCMVPQTGFSSHLNAAARPAIQAPCAKRRGGSR